MRRFVLFLSLLSFPQFFHRQVQTQVKSWMDVSKGVPKNLKTLIWNVSLQILSSLKRWSLVDIWDKRRQEVQFDLWKGSSNPIILTVQRHFIILNYSKNTERKVETSFFQRWVNLPCSFFSQWFKGSSAGEGSPKLMLNRFD